MTEYYVDNSGADGDGSIGSPWNNIAGHTIDLSADDTMYIRGDIGSHRIYTESPIVCGNSGSDGSPITIIPYGSELVTLKTTPEASNRTFTVTGDWWVIDGLKMDKDYVGGGSSQVEFHGCAHVIVQYCELIQNGGDGAIQFSYNLGGDYVTIDNCVIHDTYKGDDQDAHGIMINMGDHIIIKNNTIYDCRGDCIQAWDGGGAIGTVTIEDNHLYTTLGECSETAIDIKKGAATIRRNEIHGFRYCTGTCGGSGGGCGDAIRIQSDALNPIIEDNEIYDCVTAAAFYSDDITFRRNRVHDLVSDSGAFVEAGVYTYNCDNIKIYNNTFHDLPEYLWYIQSTTTNVDIKNNLMYKTGSIVVDGGYTADYNGWFDVTDSVVGANDTTGAGDPGFVDAAGDDYRLLSISVCIDAGVDVGLDYYGDAPDLGYWEYEPTVPPVAVLREPGASVYKIRFKTAAGILLAEIVNFEELCYTKRVNRPGLCMFKLDGDHTVIDTLEHRSQVEIWRANPKLQLRPHCDFYGLYLSPDRFQSERSIFTTICPGQMWFLSTRIIAWYAATADRTAFTTDPAETIMKTLVDYNACTNATTGNSRLRNGAVTGLSIQGDGGRGNSLDWNCAYKNLLAELQSLALVGGGDFDLIKTGAQAWEFRWYTGQRGNDRSASIIFARERGNMINPRYRHDRLEEKTAAIVGGLKEKSERDIVIRTGNDYSAANDVEVFVQATNRSTTTGYNAAGDKRLDELRAREEFSFEVVQTPSCFYGQVAAGGDYEIGDLATARAFGIEEEQKIIGVTVTVIPGADRYETIDIEVETP